MQSNDDLDALFYALSDRTRRAILSRLSNGDATATELCAPFALRRPTVSKHLNVLEHAGLVRTTRKAQFRIKSLNQAKLKSALDWLNACQAHWEASFDRLEDHLSELEQQDHVNDK